MTRRVQIPNRRSNTPKLADVDGVKRYRLSRRQKKRQRGRGWQGGYLPREKFLKKGRRNK